MALLSLIAKLREIGNGGQALKITKDLQSFSERIRKAFSLGVPDNLWLWERLGKYQSTSSPPAISSVSPRESDYRASLLSFSFSVLKRISAHFGQRLILRRFLIQNFICLDTAFFRGYHHADPDDFYLSRGRSVFMRGKLTESLLHGGLL